MVDRRGARVHRHGGFGGVVTTESQKPQSHRATEPKKQHFVSAISAASAFLFCRSGLMSATRHGSDPDQWKGLAIVMFHIRPMWPTGGRSRKNTCTDVPCVP